MTDHHDDPGSAPWHRETPKEWFRVRRETA